MLRTQESGLLTRILSNEFPENVHERMLVALKDMMMAEEHRLEDNAAMQVTPLSLPYVLPLALYITPSPCSQARGQRCHAGD